MTTLAPSFIFDCISVFILAGNERNYKISKKIEIRRDRTKDCGVSCPWASENPNRLINVVTTLAPSFLIESTSFLQVTRTCIKAWMSLNFDQIPPPTPELSALEYLKN